jgi:hypothetical protein
MKLDISFFLLAFCQFLWFVAGIETDAYKALSEAYTKKATGVIPEGKRLAFMELWHNGNQVIECVAGYSHVRLIVGTVKHAKQTRTSEEKFDFAGKAYDLTSDELKKNKQPVGGKTDYLIDDPWKFSIRTPPNTYEYLGTVSKADAAIKTQCKFLALESICFDEKLFSSF